jgi:hypothetical protein
MILFQSQIAEHQQLAEHYRELAAKREALAQSFIEVQSQAQTDLGSLKSLVEKCLTLGGGNAIASLKTAVLELFGTDDGNDGGNQPTEPTPDTDPNEPELLCLNGETGDYLLSDGSTSIEDEDEEPPKSSSLTYAQVIKNRCSACWGYEVKSKADIKAGFINRANLNFMEAVNLERTGKEFYETVEGYLNKLYYNGQSYEWASPFASPLACLLWEDAPLNGQHCTITPIATEDNENKRTQEGEAMAYCELVKVTDAIAYQRKHDGEIICTYIGFRTKAIASSWLHFFEAITSRVELRQAKRLEGFKWEIKAKGLSIKQIERYESDCDFSKSYRSEIGSAKLPSRDPVVLKRDRITPGVKVVCALTPSETFEVTSTVATDGKFFAKSLLDERRQLFDVEAVEIVEAAQTAEPTEPVLEEGDVCEVTSDRYLGRKGEQGRLKFIAQYSENPFCIEFEDKMMRYYQRNELQFITKGEAETETKPGLHSGQVLMGNRIVTTGNYIGVTRRSSISNARRGTDTKIAAAQLVKDGLSPEMAMAVASGAPVDDASDF